MKRQFLQTMTILVFGLIGIMFTSCGGDDDASSGDNGTGVLADVEINEKNFPDGIFRNWLLSQDYGSDGVLTKSEIARVTSIDVRLASGKIEDGDISQNGKIQSLQGIEYFAALEVLYCGNNELISLDVSKNTVLKELYCWHTNLTSLDVSKNKSLLILNCNYSKVTELNVSKNTALTSLSCNHNSIYALDLSKNTALTSLSCSQNYMTTLDMTGCKALTNLDCYQNSLTTLDLTGCTALTSLDCHQNSLKTLDLTGCTALTSLSCYSNSIKEEGMETFVASLPTVKNGKMCVTNNYDGMVMTTTQVAAAKAKGWTPYYYEKKEWKEYTGS